MKFKSNSFSIPRSLQFITLMVFTVGLATSCTTNGPKTETVGANTDPTSTVDSSYFKLSDDDKHKPENALLGMQVADGLNLSLFASEPMVVNPTNIDIDEKGRVWVCEALNYRAQQGTREGGDRILIIEDKDGDGKADNSKIYYQGKDINAPLGICVLGNKVIVSCSPNVFMFTDTDGDDKPDQKEIIFTGIQGVNHDHGMHSFTFGPDGKLYGNFGNEGFQLLGKGNKPLYDKQNRLLKGDGNPYRMGMIFRCNADGTEPEIMAYNFRNNFEVAVDSYGSLWQSDNDDDGNNATRINYVMEYGNYGYVDEMTGASWQAHRTGIEAETPRKHWHLNDPGVVPNLLITGSGSPTGIIVYEGNLLPKTFQNQMIHAEPGHNVIRSYPVKEDGAGYKAEIVNIIESKDQWFRPSDVCVAPDGSLLVSDWYDPGVGGHQMGDHDRGRLIRLAPKGVAYTVPKIDLSTPDGAVLALQSPNLSTKYLAWQKLNQWGAQAEPALVNLWKSDNQRFRARALWLLSKINEKEDEYINLGLKDNNADIRITALRIAKESNNPKLIDYIKQLANDNSAQVRREAAIALRYNKSPEAAQIWADLATKYDGKDRWYLEALGIGADGQWDKYFAAWLAKVGDNWNSTVNRDIVWRSRAKEAMPLLGKLIVDPKTSETDRFRYFRAFDFQKDPSKEVVLGEILNGDAANQSQLTLLALNHMDPKKLQMTPKLKASIQQTLPSISGTPDYLSLVERLKLTDQNGELYKLMVEKSDKPIGMDAGKILLKMPGGPDIIKKAIQKGDENSANLIKTLGFIDNENSLKILYDIFSDKKMPMENRKTAITAMGSAWGGSFKLVELTKAHKIPADMESTAGNTLLSHWNKDIRKDASKYYKAPGTSDGKSLPPIPDLVASKGDPKIGEAVFARSCNVCHQVNGKGINFGPGLSQIGSKLPKDGIYNAILNPDAGISFGFEGYMLTLKDGSQMMGIISSETNKEIELKSMGGAVTKYYKEEVKARKKIDNSLMPPNLQLGKTQQELVDLVEYLASLKK